MTDQFAKIEVLESEEALQKLLNVEIVKALEEFFTRVKEQQSCMAFVHTTAGTILYTTPKFDAVFDYPRGRLLGKKVEELMPERFRQKHQTEHRPNYARSLYSRPMGSGTFIALDAHGKEFPVSIELYSEELPFMIMNKKLPITAVTVNRIG